MMFYLDVAANLLIGTNTLAADAALATAIVAEITLEGKIIFAALAGMCCTMLGRSFGYFLCRAARRLCIRLGLFSLSLLFLRDIRTIKLLTTKK